MQKPINARAAEDTIIVVMSIATVVDLFTHANGVVFATAIGTIVVSTVVYSVFAQFRK